MPGNKLAEWSWLRLLRSAFPGGKYTDLRNEVSLLRAELVKLHAQAVPELEGKPGSARKIKPLEQ